MTRKHDAPGTHRRRRGAFAAAALAACLAFADAGAARAQSLSDPGYNPFSALVGRRREPGEERTSPRDVERYVLASDSRVFLLEERGARARVRFLCGPEDARIDCMFDSGAPEIHEIVATRAPRGDVIYKTAEGETLLRIAAYGGATVFWPDEGHGVAASKSFGDDRPLSLAPASADDARRRAQAAAALLRGYTGTAIFFDVAPSLRGGAADEAVLADAVMLAAKAIAAVADDDTGAQVAAERIRKVAFRLAKEPGIALSDGALEIRIVPDQDIAGRPSSAAIARFLEESL